MKAFAQSTRSLFTQLQKIWARSFSTFDERDETRLLQEIGELREAAAIPTLATLLYSQSDRVSELAAYAIQRIVERCSPLDLAQIDPAVREVGSWLTHGVKKDNLAEISRGLLGTLGVLSFSGSGWTREAAVHRLAASESNAVLPFLLIRLNDWVLPVRLLAKEAVLKRLQSANVAAFVTCLPLILRLQQQTRGGHQELTREILDYLQRPEFRPELRKGLHSSDRDLRREAFKVLTARKHDEFLEVLEEASNVEDPVLRLWAIRAVRDHLVGEVFQTALERALHDRFMPVRREALYGLAETTPERAEPHLLAALLDSHVSIRETARFYLRKTKRNDFAAFYRDRIRLAADHISVAIAGLGETGVATDAKLISEYLTAVDPRVRFSALRAIGRLDKDSFDNEVLSALSDDSARVAKAAREIVLARRHLLDADRLWSLLVTSKYPHGRRAAVSLIAELQWWDSAPRLIAAAGSSDEDVYSRALTYLGRWRRHYQRLSTKPTLQQMAMLEEALKLHGNRLDVQSRVDAEAHLSYMKKRVL